MEESGLENDAGLSTRGPWPDLPGGFRFPLESRPPCSPVDITSIWGDQRRTAKGFTAIPYEMPKGSAAAYGPGSIR